MKLHKKIKFDLSVKGKTGSWRKKELGELEYHTKKLAPVPVAHGLPRVGPEGWVRAVGPIGEAPETFSVAQVMFSRLPEANQQIGSCIYDGKPPIKKVWRYMED